MSIKFKCVNLERRPDRKAWINGVKQDIPLEFVSAVDGKDLILTKEIYNLFQKNDFNWRRSVIGCSLSHIKLWKELVASDDEYYVVIEDDTDFISDFMKRFNYCLEQIKKDKIPFVFLGYFEYIRFALENFDTSCYPKLEIINKQTGGGTGGYMISKEGAKSILKWLYENGAIVKGTVVVGDNMIYPGCP